MPDQVEVADGLAQIDGASWNALCPNDQPFIRYEFLHALETHECVSPAEGWRPRHLLLRDRDGALRGAMPLYLKDHSWGEFVFDFAWAQAYARAGLDYYPKLVAMVPFTPVTGPRILTRDASPATRNTLMRAAVELAEQTGASSLHVLYPADGERAALRAAALMPRQDIRFMWTNRDYASFDDFLACFSAGKRKKIRRERRRVAEQGITVTTLPADALSTDDWQIVYDLCSTTFFRRGHAPYLTLEFFLAIRASLPGRMLVNLARRDGSIVGAAILFRDSTTLYGRYWGGLPGIDCLHFETCYYRGIEFCIEHGLRRFDPGTQGEHKLRRGFLPETVRSAHWVAEPAFRQAIGHYLETERGHVGAELARLRRRLPFRQSA